MLKEPKNGIIEMKFGVEQGDEFAVSCSELTNVPQDMLSAMISYFQTGKGECSVLCEELGDIKFSFRNEKIYISNETHEVETSNSIATFAKTWVNMVRNYPSQYASFFLYREDDSSMYLENICNKLEELLSKQ